MPNPYWKTNTNHKTKEIRYNATTLKTKTKSDKKSTNTRNQKPTVTALKHKTLK